MTAAMVDPALRVAVADRVAADDEVARAPADRSILRRAVARALAAEGIVVAPARWAAMVRDLVDDLGGLGPLESLLRDPAVTDVMANGPSEVWVERAGVLERSGLTFRDHDHLADVVRRVLGPLGVRLDRGRPWADAVLPGGVRLHALLPPLAETIVLTLRRVPAVVPSWAELLALGSLTDEAVTLLRGACADHRNIVICGPAGAGKTTLLSRLLGEAGRDRIVIIEDAPELQAPGVHAVHLRTAPPSADGAGGIDIAALVRNALRMRPDRLVIGEVRGIEVADMLQAMNTGHAGSLTTVHANSAADALIRLEGMALLAGVPEAAARAQVTSAVDVVVALQRDSAGGRGVTEIVEVLATSDGRVLRPRWSR